MRYARPSLRDILAPVLGALPRENAVNRRNVSRNCRQHGEAWVPIAVKDAVAAATRFAIDMYGEEELKYLRPEEFERSGANWLITLGWVEPAVARRTQGVLGSMTAGLEKLPRVYKTFHADVDSGEVTAMKIREVPE